MISRREYLNESVLEAEQAIIFQRAWHLVAMTTDVANHNDFVVASVGGREVLVHNFNGKLVAFTNVCSHRFSAIHLESSGNRALQCPYHRWTYNERGCPHLIPLRKDFTCLNATSIDDLALEPWHLDRCGEAVFVALRPRIGLREFLGVSADWIDRITGNLGNELPRFERVICANWKIIMQNTVEFYHVYSVHSETFAQLVKLPPMIKEQASTPPHIHYIAETRDGLRSAVQEIKIRKVFRGPPSMECQGYEHLLLWPTLTIGHTNGDAYAFFQYTPLDAGRTRLVVRTWLPAFSRSDRLGDAMAGLMRDNIMPFTQRLADEDSAICEAVHRGIRNLPLGREPLFGDGEFLVKRFQDYYAAEMLCI